MTMMTALFSLDLQYWWVNLKRKSCEISHSSFNHLNVVKLKHRYKHLFNEFYIPDNVFIRHLCLTATLCGRSIWEDIFPTLCNLLWFYS